MYLVCRLLLEKKEHKSELHSPMYLVDRLLIVTKNDSHCGGCFTYSDTVSARYLLALCRYFFFFFFNDTATTEIYTLSLHDALPIPVRTRTATQEVEQGRGRIGRPF